jgi:hypothetical protein
MSKISKAVMNHHDNNGNRVVNFMGGVSYTLDPLQSLEMIASSSIFGEPAYYRNSGFPEKHIDVSDLFVSIFDDFTRDHKTTADMMTEAIDKALAYDFTATLEIAVKLRTIYMMRTNPQIIMVRAAIHPDRQEWTKHNKGKFDIYENKVMLRPDEPLVQIAYYMYLNNGSKSRMPSILKRALSKKISAFDAYQINKYKNAEIGMINGVRITHASSPEIDELMRTGTIQIPDEKKTWEQIMSEGNKTWTDIAHMLVNSEIHMGHMALLRNLRNIFSDLDENDSYGRELILRILVDGVPNGKQFPFRYYSAYNVIQNSTTISSTVKADILDTLSECIDISIQNMPKLKGKTACLSDNSGSAWGSVTSEYGSVTVAIIDNLSSLIAARCSDSGVMVVFGDKFKEYPVSKRDSLLTQLATCSRSHGSDVGHATEGGLFTWFKNAIDNRIFYDNIFIFSDMQAGTGGLYGEGDVGKLMRESGFAVPSHPRLAYYSRTDIDLVKLIDRYRQTVNPDVNVFSTQTAGYDNQLVFPKMGVRQACLYGWTGKEILFAAEYIRQWNNIQNKNNQ